MLEVNKKNILIKSKYHVSVTEKNLSKIYDPKRWVKIFIKQFLINLNTSKERKVSLSETAAARKTFSWKLFSAQIKDDWERTDKKKKYSEEKLKIFATKWAINYCRLLKLGQKYCYAETSKR